MLSTTNVPLEGPGSLHRMVLLPGNTNAVRPAGPVRHTSPANPSRTRIKHPMTGFSTVCPDKPPDKAQVWCDLFLPDATTFVMPRPIAPTMVMSFLFGIQAYLESGRGLLVGNSTPQAERRRLHPAQRLPEVAGHSIDDLERETGVEPATSTLARSRSTTELLPLGESDYKQVARLQQ